MKAILTIILLLASVPGRAATYYMRGDGTAATIGAAASIQGASVACAAAFTSRGLVLHEGILRSPGGTYYKLLVSDAGVLSTVAVP